MTGLPKAGGLQPPLRHPSRPDRLATAAWLALAAAGLFFAFKAVPRLFYHLLDTETVVLNLLSHDLLVEHHPFTDWMWGGFTALFPDLGVYFALKVLHPHGFFALQGTMVFFFLSWLAGIALLVRALDRPAPLLLTALLWLGVVGVAVGGLDSIALPDPFFQPVYHAGTHTLCLFALALFFFQIRRGGKVRPALLLVLIFLATQSDILFVVDFAVPALAALALLAVKFPPLRMRLAGLAAVIVGGVYFGYSAITVLSPFPNSRVEQYLVIPWERIHAQLAVIWHQLHQPDTFLWTLLVALDAVVVAGSAVAIPVLLVRSRNVLLLGGLTFAACAICSEWGALVLQGSFQRMYQNRYLTEALIMPFFVGVFLLHGAVRWPRAVVPAAGFLAAVLIAAAAFLPQPPSGPYADARRDIPFLRQVMARNHITAGLADYWKSNLYTAVSQQSVILRSTELDGRICRLFQDLAWYGAGRPFAQSPRFRLYLDPATDLTGNDNYGPPDQVLTAPSGAKVWIYSEARAIRYNPYFDLLSNKFGPDGSTLTFDLSKMLLGTGRVEGKAVVARAGQDKPDFLIYGPFLRLQPGRYRVDYGFSYLTPPAKGQEASYDLNAHDWFGAHISDPKILPDDGRPHETLTDTFTNTVPDESYEIRIYYHGSGTLRVDSLTVTSLDNLP